MHTEILTEPQSEVLSLVKKFSRSFYLVGGTAIALILGHRRSEDYDLFTQKPLRFSVISKRVSQYAGRDGKILSKDIDQVHYRIKGIKTTFFQFPFAIPIPIRFDGIIRMPDLITLGAMKAFALGGRAKWRDYVDLYFILKYHHSIGEIQERALALFGDYFNERLFKEQLAFFEGVEKDTLIEFIGIAPPDEEIKSFLIDAATQPF